MMDAGMDFRWFLDGFLLALGRVWEVMLDPKTSKNHHKQASKTKPNKSRENNGNIKFLSMSVGGGGLNSPTPRTPPAENIEETFSTK